MHKLVERRAHRPALELGPYPARYESSCAIGFFPHKCGPEAIEYADCREMLCQSNAKDVGSWVAENDRWNHGGAEGMTGSQGRGGCGATAWVAL